MQRDNIKISGVIGTWYVIDEGTFNGENVYLLENEQQGDGTPCIIVNENLKLIATDVWNGLDELYEIFEMERGE